MVTLILRSGIKKFNLKNYERENALYNAWYAMHGDPKFEDKKLKIVTDLGEVLELKISEIMTCEVDESTYVKTEVKTSVRNEEADLLDELTKSQNANEKRKTQLFLAELRKRKIAIDVNDKVLQQTLDSVMSDSELKIPFYANFYAKYTVSKHV